MLKLAVPGNRLYYLRRATRWDKGVGAELPESYKKFWKEWKLTPPEPVHYIPLKGKWKYDRKSGTVLPVQNVPLPLKYPKEFHEGLWGGEAVVQGFVKKDYDKRRVPKFWIPHLRKSVVYSEVLDKYMSTMITYRTLTLIHENYGFDHYILKTRACDLNSHLALKIKREILTALADKTLYPDDAEKREEIYERYKHYLADYTREDIEWYGYTFNEAIRKYMKEKKDEEVLQPLKHIYRQKLIEELKVEKTIENVEDQEVKKRSWLAKLNPFSNQQ